MTALISFTFEIDSDLYVAGRTEDGQDYTAEVYFVTATDARGNRWRHEQSFKGCNVERDDEGDTHFCDVRPQAQAKAANLLARIINAGGNINLQHWHEARPVYGSNAYVSYGQFDDWMDDQRERLAA